MLSDPRHAQLDITDALPRSLQQLRLTEFHRLDNMPKNDSGWDLKTRDLGGMERLQSVYITDHDWAELWLPCG